jgi:hypothetical protein
VKIAALAQPPISRPAFQPSKAAPEPKPDETNLDAIHSDWGRLGTLGGLFAFGSNATGVIGGAYSTYTGIRHLEREEYVEAGADFIGAAAGMTQGVRGFMGKPDIRGIGGIAALSDAAKDAYLGVKNHSTEKYVISVAKAAAGGCFMAASLGSPSVLTVAGAVLYSGAVTYDNRKEVGEWYHKIHDWLLPS